MKTVGKYVIDVDESKAVRVWEKTEYDAGNEPFLLQPTHPEGHEFASVEDAYAWVEERLPSWDQVVVRELE